MNNYSCLKKNHCCKNRKKGLAKIKKATFRGGFFNEFVLG